MSMPCLLTLHIDQSCTGGFSQTSISLDLKPTRRRKAQIFFEHHKTKMLKKNNKSTLINATWPLRTKREGKVKGGMGL